MGGFTRFSCRWDFARFLPHMYSLIYDEGWCHSILLLKSNLKTSFKVHLSLFWCSQVVCLIPPEAGEIVLEMFFFSAFLISIVFILCLQAFKPHCLLSQLRKPWYGGHPNTCGKTLWKYGGSMYQSENLEFPMSAWLLERSTGTGEHQVYFATWRHSQMLFVSIIVC